MQDISKGAENSMLDLDTVDRLDVLSIMLELNTPPSPSSSTFDVNKAYNKFCAIIIVSWKSNISTAIINIKA